MAKELTISRALPDDAKDFANLIALSAPSFFPTLYGNNFKDIMQYLFIKYRNLFSFQHAYFSEISAKKAGMILGYDWRAKKQEDLQTGLQLLKYMRFDFVKRIRLFMKVKDVIGWVRNREYYISNIATYPEYRGMGIATSLIVKIENEAKMNGAKRVGLDVEVENSGTIKLYKRLGYLIDRHASIRTDGGKSFHFYRMYKRL